MAIRQRETGTPSTPKSRSELRSLESEFWDNSDAQGGERRKAAFADSVTGARRWIRARRRP